MTPGDFSLMNGQNDAIKRGFEQESQDAREEDAANIQNDKELQIRKSGEESDATKKSAIQAQDPGIAAWKGHESTSSADPKIRVRNQK